MLLFKKCNLRILADLAIKAVMGHRLEPKSQALPSFKLTLREFPRVSLKLGCHPPLLPLWHPLDSSVSFVVDYSFCLQERRE